MQFHKLFGLVFAGCLITACGTGGAGGSGGGGGGNGGAGGQDGCSAPTDCVVTTAECEVATCNNGVCGVGAAPDGTKAQTQVAGDCKSNVCREGTAKSEDDDTDTPDASGDCKVDACDGGVPATTPEAQGTACTVDGGKVCNATGQCVACNVTADCTDAATPVCDAASNTCVALSCMDDVKNGDETDADCGGSCAPCADGKVCAVGADCTSGVCKDDVCQVPACDDGVKNAVETDVDCGGGTCAPCGPDLGCMTNEDCVGGECTGVGGTCIPNCSDEVKNNTESDVDCGGTCSVCADGQLCDGLDANCLATSFCEVDVCAPKKALAAACMGGNACVSGNCVDGVCCASICNGLCFSCALPGQEGSCDTIVAQDPDDECDGNGGTDVCNGSGQCAKATGSACSGSADCGTGYCFDGVCCDAFCDGICQACSAAKTGAADGTCANVTASTDPDNECAGSLACNGNGACMPKLANGTPCTLNQECQSSFCVDGVCCNGSCLNTCRACDNAGSVGTCTFIPAGTDPDNECGGATPNCNGTGQCQ